MKPAVVNGDPRSLTKTKATAITGGRSTLSAKPKGIRTQPCEAAYPGNGPLCSAMPFQVLRSMFGIQASS
jgi:hypothetical protein